MIAIIVATDQLVWRPVIAWADKFKFEQVESYQSRHLADPLCSAPLSTLSTALQQQTIEPLRRAHLPAILPRARLRASRTA